MDDLEWESLKDAMLCIRDLKAEVKRLRAEVKAAQQKMVYSDTEDSYFGKYRRPGESLLGQNILGWYGSAVFWRRCAERAETRLREVAAILKEIAARDGVTHCGRLARAALAAAKFKEKP